FEILDSGQRLSYAACVAWSIVCTSVSSLGLSRPGRPTSWVYPSIPYSQIVQGNTVNRLFRQGTAAAPWLWSWRSATGSSLRPSGTATRDIGHRVSAARSHEG